MVDGPPRQRRLEAPPDSIELTDADGRLRRDAVGWSERPLHHCALRGPRGRRKRWDYWCVTTREGALMITVADVDYVGLVEVAFVEFPGVSGSGAPLRVASAPMVTPLALGIRQPDTVLGGDVHFEAPHVRVHIAGRASGTVLEVRGSTLLGPVEASLFVHRAPTEESLNVVVPFSGGGFAFTSKHVAQPVSGTIRALGRRVEVGPEEGAFACLDYGRGVWPYRTRWNWGTAAGTLGDGRRVGIQMGGGWTDGTGATENGIFVDGRLTKIHEDLVWTYDCQDVGAPWRITAPSGALDVTLTPFVPLAGRRSRIELGLGSSRLDLRFGSVSGVARVGTGERIAFDDFRGWCEEHVARW